MSNKYKRYMVDDGNSFYDCMIGKLVDKTDRSLILEFELLEQYGGIQRVHFYEKQLMYSGKY